jgi:diguanylate cyclase (GGDEF)-like protein/PAS domain S-box-containing protein
VVADAMSDAAFRSLIEHSADVICHLVDGRFTYISPSASRIFGWDPQAMVGTDGMNLVYEEDLPIIEGVFARLFSEQADQARSQVRVVCGDGSTKWAETSAQIDHERAGGAEIVLVIRDITDRKRLETELEALALQDGLTGLANRRHFDQTLDRVWRNTLNQGGEMALLLLDVDHFKQFNDSYGHQAGDDCLRAIAGCVREHVRHPGNLACRYGGEELAVILSEPGPNAAFDLAEKIRSAIAALALPHETSSSGSYVTVSIGVATAIARVGGSIRMPESLLQAADHALYKAKAGGRNRVERTVLIAPSDQA